LNVIEAQNPDWRDLYLLGGDKQEVVTTPYGGVKVSGETNG
jgi:hypothetical protein